MRMAEQLRQRNFDAAVIFTVYSQNPLPAAFLCYLAEHPASPGALPREPVPTPDGLGEGRRAGAEHPARGAAAARPRGDGGREGRATSASPCASRRPRSEKVAGLLTAAGLDFSRPWFVLHPGATAASRRYPPEQFAAVARRLIEEAGAQVVFTGSTAEIELIERPPDPGMRRGWRSIPPGAAASIGLAGLLDLRRDGCAPGARAAADLEQHRAGAHRRRPWDARGRAVCADESAAHAVADARARCCFTTCRASSATRAPARSCTTTACALLTPDRVVKAALGFLADAAKRWRSSIAMRTANYKLCRSGGDTRGVPRGAHGEPLTGALHAVQRTQ